jgi:hypothetical protein
MGFICAILFISFFPPHKDTLLMFFQIVVMFCSCYASMSY